MPACLVFVLQLKQSCRQKHATDKADVPILQRYVQIFGQSTWCPNSLPD